MPMPGRRILIVGTTGSGKTTLARALAARLKLHNAEQDAWFHGPDWQPVPLEQFRAQVERFTRQDAWIMDGNYSKAQDIGWPRADTLMWLDYPAPVVFGRLLSRTLRRMTSRQELWNGNRERPATLLSRTGILAWFFQSHWKLRRQIPQQAARFPHLKVIRLLHPRQTVRWLDSFASVLD